MFAALFPLGAQAPFPHSIDEHRWLLVFSERLTRACPSALAPLSELASIRCSDDQGADTTVHLAATHVPACLCVEMVHSGGERGELLAARVIGAAITVSLLCDVSHLLGAKQ